MSWRRHSHALPRQMMIFNFVIDCWNILLNNWEEFTVRSVSYTTCILFLILLLIVKFTFLCTPGLLINLKTFYVLILKKDKRSGNLNLSQFAKRLSGHEFIHNWPPGWKSKLNPVGLGTIKPNQRTDYVCLVNGVAIQNPANINYTCLR